MPTLSSAVHVVVALPLASRLTGFGTNDPCLSVHENTTCPTFDCSASRGHRRRYVYAMARCDGIGAEVLDRVCRGILGDDAYRRAALAGLEVAAVQRGRGIADGDRICPHAGRAPSGRSLAVYEFLAGIPERALAGREHKPWHDRKRWVGLLDHADREVDLSSEWDRRAAGRHRRLRGNVDRLPKTLKPLLYKTPPDQLRPRS